MASEDASRHVARWLLKPGIWRKLGCWTRHPLPLDPVLEVVSCHDGILEGGDWADVDLLMSKGQLPRSPNSPSSLPHTLSRDQKS